MKKAMIFLAYGLLSSTIGAVLMGYSLSYTIASEDMLNETSVVDHMKKLGKDVQKFLYG